MDIGYYRGFANELADQARQIALAYFRKPLDIESKSDNTPVSIADTSIESTLRDMINDVYPDHGILGEEYERQQSNSEFLWVIDPIDGTKSFVTGHPTFGCLIALLHNDRPVLGIIEMPALNERWVGIENEPVYFNASKATTSTNKTLSDSVTACTGVDFFNASELPVYNHISRQGKFRMFGGDCYNYGLLASGFVDVVMESDLKPFDYMALVPVIENAGGVITDWQGNPLTLESSGQILASANADLHQQCLSEIKNYTKP